MPNPRQEAEAATRRKRIDPLLTRQGWTIVAYVPGRPAAAYTHHAVTEYPTANGPADYALFVDGILLGIVSALENEDAVTSEDLIRDGLGKEHKPEDYLEAFARFVQENPAQIEAIRILLDRPQDWSTAAINELRNKLVVAPERFTVELLQKAHAIRYDKALADIISMVKHAARNEEPLTTAAERVERAFEKIHEGQEFTEEQEKWLDRIRAHLTENLSIDRDDFEAIPVLAAAGGWKPADKAFEGKLDRLLKALNEAVAA